MNTAKMSTEQEPELELETLHDCARMSVRDFSWASDLCPDLYTSVSERGQSPLPSPEVSIAYGPDGVGPYRRASSLVMPRPPTAEELKPRDQKCFRSACHPRIPPVTGERARITYALKVNLGGDRFHIKALTLRQAGGTLLAELTPAHPAYDTVNKEYFFDRSPGFFPFLLDHLNGSVTHFPHCLCPQNLLNELDFWKVSPAILPKCCNTIISDYLSEQVTIRFLEKALIKKSKYTKEQWSDINRAEKIKAYIYNFLDDPDSSIHARIWVVFYTVMVLISITIACLATVPEIREPTDPTHCMQYINSTKKYNICATKMPTYMWWTSTILNIIFFVEISIKCYTYPHQKYHFFLNFMNDMDIIAVILTLSTNFIQRESPEYWQNNILSMASLSAIASVLKVGRMTQFVKHNRGLRVLVLTLKFSKGDLLVLLFLMAVTMLLYSVAIYIAEYQVEDVFMSIPEGMWWSLITMTTVGYNDMRPTNLQGYLIGSICAMFGVIITGTAIPLTANSFDRLTKLSRTVGTRR